ncbi:putative transposase of IS4/5 family DUF4096 [Actinokineospora auranticolor]|uniref:Putative transposase of IS4/5 family DUF4096 n=1 Tax=Actinokineospora auranticolor TaxID=155976 RepID=A0A2S6GPK8_9PSEU|nr:putative transposase of IS4/5 family DUF4096 [Actinokineospora auranticolor]
MIGVVVDALSARLVPDALWELVEPLVPGFAARPQGGGTAGLNDRVVFTAVVYVLTSGCGWRELPTRFGVSVPTAHRRFAAWTKAGLWKRIQHAVLDRLGERELLDWSAAVVAAAAIRAEQGLADRSGSDRPDQERIPFRR